MKANIPENEHLYLHYTHTAVLFFFFYFTGDTVKTRLSKQEMKVQSARITEKDKQSKQSIPIIYE